MNVNFRKIVELLKIDAPVHYTPRDKMDKKDYVFCRILGNDERSALISGNHSIDGKYDTSDMGLHFPDIEVEEFYDLESERNPIAIDSIIKSISNICIVYLSEYPLIFTIYCILHEYGHWIHFLNANMTPYEYSEWERKERQSYEKLRKKIYDMPDHDPYKLIIAKKFHDEIYSQFPSEKSANQYALDNILESLNLIRNYLGYSEKDLNNFI